MMLLLLFPLAGLVAPAVADTSTTSANTATTITTQDLAGLPICAVSIHFHYQTCEQIVDID